MTDIGNDCHRKKFKEKKFFLEVDVTESLHKAMSKIPHLKNADFESDEQLFKDNSMESEPFVELGAFNKLLVALKPECLKFTETTETSITEVIWKLKYLLEYWHVDEKKMKNILTNDNSLMKCEQCGVISLRKRKCRGIGKIVEKGSRSFITPR